LHEQVVDPTDRRQTRLTGYSIGGQGNLVKCRDTRGMVSVKPMALSSKLKV
jgi:hypothetical protein